jgi:hypothetical protein
MTKGKWEVACTKIKDRFNIVVNRDGKFYHIADIPHFVAIHHEEAEENAKLIALAGNLSQVYNLECIGEVIEQLKLSKEWFIKINAILPASDYKDAIGQVLKAIESVLNKVVK